MLCGKCSSFSDGEVAVSSMCLVFLVALYPGEQVWRDQEAFSNEIFSFEMPLASFDSGLDHVGIF